MKKLFLLTTIILVVFFIPKIASAGIIINEICWMGNEISVNDEWLELKSTNSETVDLTGWTLEAVDGSPLINLEGTIPANGYFLLERTDDTSVPSVTADQIYTGALGNTGEYLKLKNTSNTIIDEINASDGWPAGDNTTKQTMERTADGWQTSLNPGGTPGASNSSGATESSSVEAAEDKEPEIPPVITGNNPPVPDAGDNIIAFIDQEINFDAINSSDPDGDELAYSWNMGNGDLIEEPKFTYKYLYPGTYLVTLMVYDGQYYVSETITVKIQSQEIIINEFIPNPEGDDAENEWIEIYNDSNSIVDISGWQLDDEEEGSKPFTFPKNTLIAPKSYLVFARPVTKIALNNDIDSVRLLLPGGVVFQEIQYEKPKEGQSSANTAEGFVWSMPTPGMANIISPPPNIGGLDEGITYNYQVEPEITKEPTEDYSWYYNKPDKDIEGGYAVQLNKDETKKDLAMIEPLLTQKKITASVENSVGKKSTINLILLIIAVTLGAMVIGLLITRLRKKIT